jgi:FtsZ-binding cell division protein ZapB
LLDSATEALKSVQQIDAAARFQPPVSVSVDRIVKLFRQIRVEVLPDLPEHYLEALKKVATEHKMAVERLLALITSIHPMPDGRARAFDEAGQVAEQLSQAYDKVFDEIWPCVGFSLRATEFETLDREVRAKLESVKTLSFEVGELKESAQAVLKDAREAAGLAAVSKQAQFFETAANEHKKQATCWLITTVCATAVLLGYAILALFSYKSEWLAPATQAEAIQLVVGKALVFITIASFVLLSARNFQAHQHNAVVNRHRQNSLSTYGALVEASSAQANRDIVLAKASECIFAPQPTGFSKNDHDGGASSLVQVGSSLLNSGATK